MCGAAFFEYSRLEMNGYSSIPFIYIHWILFESIIHSQLWNGEIVGSFRVTWMLVCDLGVLPFDIPMSTCVSIRNAGFTELSTYMTHNCLLWSEYITLYEHLFFFGVKKWFRTSLNQIIYFLNYLMSMIIFPLIRQCNQIIPVYLCLDFLFL